MSEHEKVNILLVDDQPSKLLSYEVILHDLHENLLKASSGREALEHLLKSEVAVVLVDVCMPDLDGFQLAAMIREHPRFQKTAMIFISAIHLSDMDRLRGYEMGAVDYVPVPVIPEVLRAKVKIFAELYRKTTQLERMNAELEGRVQARTAELEQSTRQLQQSEERRSVALAAGQMGSWDWNIATGECLWDTGQYRIFGVDPGRFTPTFYNVRPFIHHDDLARIETLIAEAKGKTTFQTEVRIVRPKGETRWCICAGATTPDSEGRIVRVSGVSIDITERKEAEERQALLAREVDHRAKNALALVQSIVRLTRANTIEAYTGSVEGRIRALSRAHAILSHSRWQGADMRGLVDEELAPYRTGDLSRIIAEGPNVSLQPAAAQSLALALHELVTNAAKYGALSADAGRVDLNWEMNPGTLVLRWTETGGPLAKAPASPGFGTRIITAGIEGQLGGRAEFDWRPEGLQCVLSVPRAEMTRGNGSAAIRPAADASNAERKSAIGLAGNQILVVEDEALVAMALRESLSELGYSVVGPFSRMSEAILALRNARVDAAVLDINLGGEMVYPLADVLTADHVPFIFVTGYGADEIERRFASVPVLQKPIELDALRSVFERRATIPGLSSSAANRRSMAN
jgi:two-component sensor histidine kinase/DNA-binding response OmpR family regulator